MDKDKYVVIDDTNIVAFLNLRGFNFTPFIKDGALEKKRVGFKIQGDIDDALMDYYSNKEVPIQDYITCLKKVRGAMFMLKGINEDEHKI